MMSQTYICDRCKNSMRDPTAWVRENRNNWEFCEDCWSQIRRFIADDEPEPLLELQDKKGDAA
jgi:hypothetical protein